MKFDCNVGVFKKGNEYIFEGIDFKRGRALPTGWSCSYIYHGDKEIGCMYCGYPKDLIEGYSYIEFKIGDEMPNEILEYFNTKKQREV